MKKLLVLFFLGVNLIYGQNNADLQKLVETEKAFAKAAEAKGTKAAFLEYLADEGIVFSPTATNGKESWKNRPASPALLVWNPTFADISANGSLGYTTGDWSFHPKGKEDAPTAFGQYFTIWQKQGDGNYKAVLDLGVSHPKPATVETAWKSPTFVSNNSDKKPSATEAAQGFFAQVEKNGLSKAYKTFASEDVRLLREGTSPILGKLTALEKLKNDKSTVNFSKRMFLVSGGDFAYVSDAYTLVKADKSTVTGNLVQVWRLRNGEWQIVMDVWNELQPEKN